MDKDFVTEQKLLLIKHLEDNTPKGENISKKLSDLIDYCYQWQFQGMGFTSCLRDFQRNK